MSNPQPIKQLTKILESLATEEHYLFTLSDLRASLPIISSGAFKVLLSRAEKSGLFMRVCRGLYLYPKVNYQRGLLLFHAAARLRADEFNYISFETALSDAGVISQVPINWITLMSSGRSNVIRCGDWGTL
jgi:predicted transcriptional regulator of viral defense system